MRPKIRLVLLFLSFAILLGTFLIIYTSSKVWDYDFWWHLATGRYIVETGSLPDSDPFTLVNNLKENQHVKNPLGMQFNLKQYWLAQVLFYKVYNSFGDAGMMILRGIMLLSMVVVVLASLIRQKVGYFIIFPLLFCVHMNNFYYFGERPVLFTLLFSVVAFYLLEGYKLRPGRVIFALIPLMLLWANMHGGFILGIILIGTYLVGETINYFLKKGALEKRELIILHIAGGIAIAVSALNPNGFTGFLAISHQYTSMFQAGVQEYFSPFVLYKNKTSSVNWSYIAMLVVFPIVFLLRNRKMDITHLLLLGGLAYMSITALRYVVFYVTISAMVLGVELQLVVDEYSRKYDSLRSRLESVFIVLICLSSLLYSVAYLKPGSVVFGKAVRFSVPEDAADFIEKHNIKGNIFNDMAYGGYLSWRFYPDRMIFYDSRALNYTVMTEYQWIVTSVESVQNPKLPEGKEPLWSRLLDHYKIDLMLLNTRDAFGSLHPIIFSLIKSDEWVPVFYDGISVLFVRDKENNQELIDKYRIDEENIYNMLIATFSDIAMNNTSNPYFMVSLGDIFYNMQSYADALQAYEYADKRLPGHAGVAEKISAAKRNLAD
ncbi:MAG: hypothetical protein C0402_06635 [Thermodesulfovibrio sp.]|nr:hypothetical protein [Thermodesulfovibrio sp.]